MVSTRRIFLTGVVVVALLASTLAYPIFVPSRVLVSSHELSRPSVARQPLSSGPGGAHARLSLGVSANPARGGRATATPVALSRPSVPPPGTTSAAAASSPEILAGWDALHSGNNAGNVDPWMPPDVQVAAGPNHVVEMVNNLTGIYTKQGSPLRIASLSTFFAVPLSDFLSDPKIQYDAASQRWFASITDVSTSSVLLNVSRTSDSTGGWNRFSVSAPGCLDQPILGVGTVNVILSVNVFSSCTAPNPTYVGAKYWVINRTDLLNGAPSPAIYASATNSLEASIHPVQLLGASASHYMVSTYWPGTATTSNTLHLFTVSGSPPGTVTVSVTSLSMPTASLPPGASQLGTSHTLDTGDIRVSDAVWSSGRLWLGFDEACLSDTTRACVRLVEIGTASKTILQDFDLDVAGRHVFYPGLRVDGLGDLAVVFGYSSASEYPGIMVTGQVYGDAAGVLQPPQIVALGNGPENPGSCTSVCRYGDYFGAGVDPSNASVLWLAGEFGSASGWSTHVFAASVKAILTFDYHIRDGGFGFPLPTVAYVSHGAAVAAPLGLAPARFYADPGTAWSVSAILLGPNPGPTPSEVWIENDSATGLHPTGTATSSLTANFTYFHQYLVDFGYGVAGGGSGLVRPMVQVVRYGQTLSLDIAASASQYVDAGTPYAYPGIIPGSGSEERWIATGGVSGSVTGPMVVSVLYYHQYRITFNYQVQQGTPAPPPAVHYHSQESNVSVRANATVWADALRPYVYDGALAGSSDAVRVGAGPGAVGTVDTNRTITVVYRTQYRLAVLADPGSLAPGVSGAGWYDAGSVATVSATAPSGWKFVGWAGAVSGSAATISVPMTAPANVTALFDAGLTITAGDGGFVSYAYGTVVGTVPAGSSITVYVPPGSVVNFSAVPSSWTETFVAWGGAVNGTSGKTTVTVSAPTAISASFGLNTFLLAGVATGILAAILAAILVLLILRRRRRGQPPAGMT